MSQQETTYEITFDTPDLDTYELRAAYTAVDERLFPGWVLFKNEHSDIVAKVRTNRTLAIARTGALPERPPLVAEPRPAAPSPADLAARSRRAGDQ